MTGADRSTQASINAHLSWANTENPTERTAPARRALEAKFFEQADGDPKRAAHLRKAYFKRLALKSAQSRRRAKDAMATAKTAEDELSQLARGAQ